MMIHKTFNDAIGQDSVKRTLSVYIDSFERTSRLPFINLVTQKGGGKSFFARKFREGLKRPDGTRPRLLEVNAASLKNANTFFEQVYPTWVNNDAFLFLDEGHNLPPKLQQIFLSVLDVKSDPVRVVEFNDVPYTFDFNKISFCMATTDQQKLVEPLRDRLRDIAFEEYTTDELYEIFENNLKGVAVDFAIRDNIKQILRGNPRDAVVKALDLNTFASAKQVRVIDLGLWNEFCVVMGVNDCGLNHAEKSIVKALSSRLESGMSLTNLACVTGFDRAVIQKDYEGILMRKGLLEIDGKRRLTPKGVNLAREMNFIA